MCAKGEEGFCPHKVKKRFLYELFEFQESGQVFLNCPNEEMCSNSCLYLDLSCIGVCVEGLDGESNTEEINRP